MGSPTDGMGTWDTMAVVDTLVGVGKLEHSWERGQKLYYRSGSHLARLGSPTNGMETGDTGVAVDTLVGVRKGTV